MDNSIGRLGLATAGSTQTMYCVGRQAGEVDNMHVIHDDKYALDAHAHMHMCMRMWYSGVVWGVVRCGGGGGVEGVRWGVMERGEAVE